MISFWGLPVVYSSVSESFLYHETHISSKFCPTPPKDLHQFEDFICTNPGAILKLEHLQTRTQTYWTQLQAGWSRVSFPMVSLKFFIDKTLPAALWPWGRLSL